MRCRKKKEKQKQTEEYSEGEQNGFADAEDDGNNDALIENEYGRFLLEHKKSQT